MRKKQTVLSRSPDWRYNDHDLEKSFKQLHMIFDDILLTMNDVINVEQHLKNKEIVWLLQSYGKCCDLTGNYEKSVEIHGNAKQLMEVVFGEDNDRYRALGHCYNALAESHKCAVQNEANLKSFKRLTKLFFCFAVIVWLLFGCSY